MKKILIAALLGTAMFLAGCSNASPSIPDSADTSSSSKSEAAETSESSEITDSSEATAFPQTLEDVARLYSFSIDGTSISLPATFDDMRTVDLTLDDVITSDTVRANTYSGIRLHNSKGAEFKVDLYGSKDTDVAMDQSKIVHIDVKEKDAEALGIHFETADGITFGDSIDKAVRLYGGTLKDNESGPSLYYRFTEEMAKQGLIGQDQSLSAFEENCAFYADKDGKINHIVMTYNPEP